MLEENGHASATTGELFSASTALEGVLTEEIEKGEQVAVNFTFDVPLRHGHYSITTALRMESKNLDRVDATAAFEISRPANRSPFRGVVPLPAKIKVRAPERKQQDGPN
ncbi:MAG TPA: Wzt carbohydrate-binding domain-containing protein [Rubrobacteraceae bacterium]|nr:Wzt carbohydrate-binding domain-containing protein [Rubrobacteraceae bacterium]